MLDKIFVARCACGLAMWSTDQPWLDGVVTEHQKLNSIVHVVESFNAWYVGTEAK